MLIDLLAILQKSLGQALFSYTFICEVRSSGQEILSLLPGWKLEFTRNYDIVSNLLLAANRIGSNVREQEIYC